MNNIEEPDYAISLEDGEYEIDDIKDILIWSELDLCDMEAKDDYNSYLKRRFGDKYEQVFIGNAYETGHIFVFGKKPRKLIGKESFDLIKGSGFNYGSTNVIMPHDKILLILAEND